MVRELESMYIDENKVEMTLVVPRLRVEWG